MNRRRRFHPVVEFLETRQTPAGTVTGSFSQGTWTLIGDAEANDITINPTATPGSFDLVGNGTAVAGVTNPQNVKNIVIKLFAGADAVTFNDTAMQANLSGKLTIRGGSDANSVFIDNTIVGKKVTIVNGTNAAGKDDFEMTDSIIRGKLVINNGDGDANTFIHRTTPGVSSIGGFSVLGGAGRDDYTISDYNFAGSIVVKNGLPDGANNAGYFEIYNSDNTTARSLIQGNVKVNFKAGTIDFLDLLDVEVQGNVVYNHGAGASEIKFDGHSVVQPALIHGKLTINDAGPVVLKMGTVTQQTGLFVGKSLTITTGNGADTFDIHRLRVNGATKIVTGGGIDTITIDDSHFAGPPATIKPFGFQLLTGAGDDVVDIETSAGTSFVTQFTRAALINLGGNNDTLTMGANGDDTRKVEFFARANLKGGGDNDTFNQFNVVSTFGFPILVDFETVNP